MGLKQDSKIIIRTNKMIHFILTSEILYLHAKNSSTYIALNDGQTIKASRNLKYISNLLGDDPTFYSPHRSYLINTNFVINLISVNTKFKIILNGGEKIPLIQKKRLDFLTKYKNLINNYLSNDIK
jgi:two-component system LytT family response regulator